MGTGSTRPQPPAIESRQISALRDSYRQERERLLGSPRTVPVARLIAALTRNADRTLCALWRAQRLPADALLVAVGGYGRRDLFAQSDVDILIATATDPTGELARRIESFVASCWDIGLEIAHSVRTLEQCLSEAEADITVQTSLLERRRLIGSPKLWAELDRRLSEAMRPAAFFTAKRLELRQRHAKYDDTPYSLEPNTKESPGGLRDVQVIAWTARAAGLGTTWSELAANGLMTARETRLLRDRERTLKEIRHALHRLAGRREDRLVFDLQTTVARELGFVDGDSRRASEELMQRYFLAAKTVTQLNTILMQNIAAKLFDAPGAEPEPIDDEFRNRGGLLEAIDPGIFERDPPAILRAFLTMQRHSDLSGMATETLRAMWLARDRINPGGRANAQSRELFMEILKQPRGITHELRRMNKWSILSRCIAPFRRIVGRMQHDLFHVYTVDTHILMVVRNLRRFAIAEHAHEYPFCSQLMAQVDKHWVLYLGALFHDLAKGRGGDHSKLGMVDARHFCRAHEIAEEDAALIAFLVEHHLTMSAIAQKRDLGDPDVIAGFARIVGTVEWLNALYLLTVADIRATGPKVWNSWKGRLLEDLYHATRRVLDGESDIPPADRLDARRRETVRALNLGAIAPALYEQLWSRLDIAYFMRNDARDVAWHTRMLYRYPDTPTPIVRARLAPGGDGFQVVVYMPDQKDLFARVCGYFDRKNLSVMDARIHTTAHGYALDSFLIVDPNGERRYRDILSLVEAELTECIQQQAPLAAPVQGRISRRSRYFPIVPQVDLRPDEQGKHYLLSIVAGDRTGLLYRIARVLGLHDVNLYTARVATLGERAEDVFLVDGASLSDPRAQLRLETDLLAALETGH